MDNKSNYKYLLSDLTALKGVGIKTTNLLKKKKINKPEKNKNSKFFLFDMIIKNVFHLAKNEVVIINITAVHKHL